MSVQKLFFVCIFFAFGCQGDAQLERSTRALLKSQQYAKDLSLELAEAAKVEMKSARYAEARLLAQRSSMLQPQDESLSELHKMTTAVWYLRARPAASALLPALAAERTELTLINKGSDKPLKPIFRFADAVRMLESNELEKARPILDELKELTNQELSGQKAVLLFELGKLAIRQKDPKSATNFMRETLALEEGFWEARMQLGQLLSQAGAHKESMEQIEKVVKQRSDGVVRYVEGRIYQKAGETARAIDAFERALSFSNVPQAIHRDLGEAYFARREYVKSQSSFARSYSLSGKVSDLFNQGMSLKGAKAFRQSAQRFERVVQLQPNSGRAHVELISALMAESNVASAQAALDRYLGLKEKNKGLESVYQEILAIVKASEKEGEAELEDDD